MDQGSLFVATCHRRSAQTFEKDVRERRSRKNVQERRWTSTVPDGRRANAVPPEPPWLPDRFPAGSIPSGSSTRNMGQSSASRKRANGRQRRPASGSIPVPAIPARLINSGGFDKTSSAPL